MLTMMRAGAATVLLLVAGYVRAQTTDAVCSADYSWATNDLGHNPCLVAAHLIKPCNPNGTNNVPALGEPGLSYGAPGARGLQANTCTCSTVTYSAIQACAICQGGAGLKWSEYSASCTDAMITTGGYPNNVQTDERAHIPSWMALDVIAADTFNGVRAQQFAEAQSVAASAAAVPFPPSNTSTSNSSSTKKKGLPLGAIVGGAVGGIACILIVAILVTLCLRSRRKRTGELRQRESKTAAAQWAVSIGKPVQPPTPATGSSFGLRGPAPTPGGSLGRSGWPADAEKGLDVPPLPPKPITVTLQPPPSIATSGSRQGSPSPVSRQANSSPVTVQRPPPGRGMTGTTDSVYSTSPTTPETNLALGAKPSTAGPPLRSRYDAEHSRTWQPSPPPAARPSRSTPSPVRISPIGSPQRMFPSAAVGPSSPSTIVLTLSPASSSGRRPSAVDTPIVTRPTDNRRTESPSTGRYDEDAPIRVGIPDTPRQQRAQRVRSKSKRREEGEARYPTPYGSPAPRPLPSRPSEPAPPTLAVQEASPGPRPPAIGLAFRPGLPASPSPVNAPRTPQQQIPVSPRSPKTPDVRPEYEESAYDGIVEDEDQIRMPVHPFSTSSASSSPRLGHARRPSPPELVVPMSRFGQRHSPQSSISSSNTPLTSNSTAPLMPRRVAKYEAMSPSPSQIISPTTSSSSGAPSRRGYGMGPDSRYPVFSPARSERSEATFGHAQSNSLDRGLRAPSPLASLGQHAYSSSVDSTRSGPPRAPLKPVTPLIQARFGRRPGSPTSSADGTASSPTTAGTTATTFAARYADFGAGSDVPPPLPIPDRYESPSRAMARGLPSAPPPPPFEPKTKSSRKQEAFGHRLTVTARPEGPRRIRK